MHPQFKQWLEEQIYMSFGYYDMAPRYSVGHPNAVYYFYTWEQIVKEKQVWQTFYSG
jgi:hypothetical protein